MADIPVQIVLRPYASSIPLAAFAFGVGNALYSAYLLQWIPASESALLAIILLAFVAPLELVPSIMAFVTRDGGGATSYAIFGAVWIVQGLGLWMHAPPQSRTTGIFLLCLALCLCLLAAVTLRGKPLLGVVLVVAVVRTCGAAAIALHASPLLSTLTGYVGLLLAALAFYSGFAFLEEDITGSLSALTFRTGEAKAAMEGSLEDQMELLEREAGVRKQL
ncbi:MAG: hypothetical protein ACRYF4_02810 [Janthinobacterium lividum]